MSLRSFVQSFSGQNRETKHWAIVYVVLYVLIAVAFIVCSIAFLYTPLNNELMQRQTTNLSTTAQGIANAFAQTSDAEAFVQAAVKDTDLRVTAISADGTVIADSEMDPDKLENHADREEVQEALQGNVGTAHRVSTSDGEEWIYVAVPATYEGTSCVLRVSEPSAAVSVIIQNAQAVSIAFIVIGCILVLIVAAIALRRSREPLKKFDQVRSDFVANASHELKTPVAGIRLLSEAIRDAAEIDDKKNLNLFIDRLENEAERLQRLVIDLLDLSRLEETVSNGDLNTQADVHSALITSYVAHKGEAEDKHLDLVLNDKSNNNDGCYADMEPSDASLVFDNLIENAIRYTEEGTITVTFEPHLHDIAVTVADTGIGIPQSDLNRIFERFYRVDKARSRELGGTGLGLSLVRHAVERSHGTVQVKSTVGKGSQFTVTFPRKKH